MVFVNLGWSKLDSGIASLTASSSSWSVDQTTGRISTMYGLDLKGSDIVNVRSILSQNGTWSIDENGVLVAQKVKTKYLELGNDTEPTGITIYDKVTRLPSCISLENGALNVRAGKCDESPPPPVILTPSGSEEEGSQGDSSPPPASAEAPADEPAVQNDGEGDSSPPAEPAPAPESPPASEPAPASEPSPAPKPIVGSDPTGELTTPAAEPAPAPEPPPPPLPEPIASEPPPTPAPEPPPAESAPAAAPEDPPPSSEPIASPPSDAQPAAAGSEG